MKKLLLSVITVLLIILIVVTMINGLKIGNINILGIAQMKTKNNELDNTINEATKLASTGYQRKIDDLNNAIKEFETKKQSYEDMVDVSTDSEVTAANQTYDNLIEFLLVRIENHANAEGVTMDMVVTRSSSGAEDVYNLNFTATGTYVGISEFITDIEDDSRLGYKIEEFKMSSSSENGNTVQATFVCKDIKISGIDSNSSTSTITTDESETTNTTENVVNNNTTDNTTDNTTENTTNNTTENTAK